MLGRLVIPALAAAPALWLAADARAAVPQDPPASEPDPEPGQERGQEASQEPGQEAEPLVRPIVQSIEILGGRGRENEIRQALLLRPGDRFEPANLDRDLEFLWKRKRIRVDQVTVVEMGKDAINLRLYVTPVEAMRRVIFVGNEEFDRQELLLAAGLTGGQAIDLGSISRVVGDLVAHYKQDGYYWVEIDPVVESERDQLRLVIREGPKVRIGDYGFEGNDAFPSWSLFGTDLAGTVETGDGWFVFPGKPYTAEMLRRDLNAIKILYQDYGYLDVEVELAEEEFYSDNSRVRVVFQIHEGPQYTVRSLQLVSALDGAPLSYPEEDLRAEIGLAEGAPFTRDRIDADITALRSFYGGLGHPSALPGRPAGEAFFRFNPPSGEPELRFDSETHEVDVIYRIQEGQSLRIRDVIIEGNTQTKDAVIRRQISLEPGDLADGEEATRSVRRLLGLGYFQDPETRAPFAAYEFRETDDEGFADLLIQVAEGQTGRLLFGGGINTNTGPFLSLNIQKDNFDAFDLPSSFGNTWSEILDGQAFTGGGQTLRVFLAPGLEFSTYSVNFTEPDLFGDHIDRTSLNLRFFKTFFFLDTHDEERTGGSVSIGRNFGRFFSVFVTPETQKVKVDDLDPFAPAVIDEIRGTNRLNAYTVGMRFSTVEDPFSPVDGGGFSVQHRRAGDFMGGDWDFHQTELALQKYFPLWEDSLDRPWVLAFEGRARHAVETGDLSRMPYSEAYFLGGQGSIRGFDFRGIGPRENGFALGGEAAWNASAEIRFPLVSSRVRGRVSEVEYVRGAFFVDAGSLGETFSDLGLTRIAAGFGLRVRIPFLPQAPLSLDFGWPIQEEPFDDTQVFSFTFGTF